MRAKVSLCDGECSLLQCEVKRKEIALGNLSQVLAVTFVKASGREELKEHWRG